MFEWITVISGIFLVLVTIYGYMKKQSLEYAFWFLSGLSFLIISIGLALLGLDALALPFTIYLGSIYPSFLALGLLFKRELHWKYYLIFIISMLFLILIGQLLISPLRTIAQVTLHTISGLIIVFLPIFVYLKYEEKITQLVFSIGGIVIGIGGMALASIVAGRPILPLEVVVALLHPLLFISAFLIALAIYLTYME